MNENTSCGLMDSTYIIAYLFVASSRTFKEAISNESIDTEMSAESGITR